jgi:hypothetical protein
MFVLGLNLQTVRTLLTLSTVVAMEYGMTKKCSALAYG